MPRKVASGSLAAGAEREVVMYARFQGYQCSLHLRVEVQLPLGAGLAKLRY